MGWLDRLFSFAPPVREHDIGTIGRNPFGPKGWFYLHPHLTRVANLPNGKREVYVTFYDANDYAAGDPAYWREYRLTRAGIAQHTPDEASKMLAFINSRYHTAHADHG
jgi:hypothetical protein